MNTPRRRLLVPLCLALLAAAPVADEFAKALRLLEADQPAAAAALLAPWCERHPDDANGWLALGCAQARAGLPGDAIRSLPKARASSAGPVDPLRQSEIAQRAGFDLARALFEKAAATPRAGLPGELRPDANLVADVRTRLALVRFELETARDLLIDQADAAPDDGAARRGLAAVSELLRTVVAEDRAWREKAEPPQPQELGQGAPASGPLKPGPSRTKSSAGATGKKTGESGGAANPAASGAPADGASPWITAAPLRPDEEQAVERALQRVRGERERSDERRADAQAQTRSVRSW